MRGTGSLVSNLSFEGFFENLFREILLTGNLLELPPNPAAEMPRNHAGLTAPKC